MAMGWAIGTFFAVYFKPLLLISIVGLCVWIAFRNVQNRRVWKILAIGLTVLLIADIIPGDFELARLCRSQAGVYTRAAFPGTQNAAIGADISRGVATRILERLGSIEYEVTPRYVRHYGLEPGFYRFRIGNTETPGCRRDWQVVDLLSGKCALAEEIPAYSARYLIARTAVPHENRPESERWGIHRYQVLIVDLETDEIIGAARKFSRNKNWSWSGISIFVPSSTVSGTGLTRSCPDATRQDLVNELFRKAFSEWDPSG